jgi:hypothetical protein
VAWFGPNRAVLCIQLWRGLHLSQLYYDIYNYVCKEVDYILVVIILHLYISRWSCVQYTVAWFAPRSFPSSRLRAYIVVRA